MDVAPPRLAEGQFRVDQAYAAAHFGKSLFWQTGELLLAFFLTEVAGLPPMAMGAVVATSLLASAASDLLVGRFWRNSLASVAGAAHLQWQGAWVAAIALIGLFSTGHLPQHAKLPFALALALMFRVGYSVYDVPQNVLLSLATRTSAARSRIASVRVAVSSLAGVCLALAIVPLLQEQPHQERALRFMLLTVLLAVLAIASAACLRHVLIHARATPGPRASERADAPLHTLPVPLLLAMFFVLLVGAPLFAKLEPYFVGHVLRSSLWGGALLLGGALGTLAAQPLMQLLLARQPRLPVIFACSLILMLVALAWWQLAPAVWAAIACAMAMGLAGGVLGMTLWAAFADAVAGRSPLQAGVAFGLLTATSKSALACGAWWLGHWLSGLDYRGEDSAQLATMMAVGPALAAAGCLLLAGGAWWVPRKTEGMRA